MEGDAKGRCSPSRSPTYNITEDFDWDSDNAQLLFEMTRARPAVFPEFLNSDMQAKHDSLDVLLPAAGSA